MNRVARKRKYKRSTCKKFRRGFKYKIGKAIGRHSYGTGFRKDILHQRKTVLYQSQVVTGTYTGEVTATLSTIPEYGSYEILYDVLSLYIVQILSNKCYESEVSIRIY